MTVLMKRKRDHDEDRQVENLAMANCLMLLSRRLENNNGEPVASFSSRVFRCKTCDREFQSFQALGGHRASHKRTKLFALTRSPTSPAKAKTHECYICGLDFPVGQALGGHMRRHRGEKTVEEMNIRLASPAVEVVPVIRKSNSKRVLCLDLDLNLTPRENDLMLGNQPGPVLQLGPKKKEVCTNLRPEGV